MAISCVSLCQSAKWVKRASLFALAFIVGCGELDANDPGNVASTGGQGEQTGGSSGGGNVGASGGSGGTSGNASGGSGGVCDSEPQPLAEYCSGFVMCELDRDRVCDRMWFGSEWQQGCGYVSITYWGDVGDRGTDIWDSESGALVYHWFNGKRSAGPDDCPTIVGTEPSCDNWSPACGTP